MIKLIACDLDGTVFDDDKNIDSNLKDVVNTLKKHGINFTVVSGRNEFLFKNVVEHFNLDTPYMANNGANIYQYGKLIYSDYIPSEYLNTIAHILYDNDITFRIYADEETFQNKTSEFFNVRPVDNVTTYDPSIDLSSYHITKMTSDFIEHDDIAEKVKAEIDQKCPNMVFIKVEDHIYCANGLHGNKGDALIKVCDFLNIDVKDTMVFGDNDNDVSMFKVAGVSIAMANSEDKVKEKADYTCLDNNHNGVSTFLKEYFKEYFTS